MPKKSKLLIFLLLLVIFTKGVVWSFFIPAWHFPDEQEHFAHIACNAEAKKECGRSAPESGNLNKEIYLSLDLLGVDRDSFGNNKFTYHPEYNIDYSGNFTGIYEKQIINIPLENRTIFVKNDIAQYPEFFYNISKIPYNLVYFSDLFTRLFAVRIFWLALVLVIVYCAFKTGEMVGSKKFALTCAVLVGFHPMLTFVSSGVTGDNLYNALSSLVILFCAYILTKGLKLKYLAVLVLLIILGIKTKPQFLIMLGIILSVVLYRTIVYLKKNKLKIKNLLIPACILVVIFAFLNFLLKYRISKITSGGFYFYLGGKTAIESYSLADHFLWTAKHTFREVLPWYWGVFRWLSLALPRWVNRVQMRILLVAGIGLVYKLVLLAKNKKFSKKDIVFLFMLYSAVLYFLVLFVWDWDFTRSHGFSFGIQGRYYFPVLSYTRRNHR